MNSKLELVLRWVAGLALLIFGANKFFNFMPALELEGDLATFFQGVMASKYLMPLVGVVEILVGLLFIAKKWMPFALVLLAPISVNIVLIHLFMDPANVLPALVIFILNTVLIWVYWDKLKHLFD
jgi:uncharacterized membrane protein YphA (DoxX/SURF4 family)